MVSEQGDGYALFSTILAEWIRNELQSAMATPQTYEAWLRDPANQGHLAQIKTNLADEVKERVLPKLKEAYWELVVGWLTNPATVVGRFFQTLGPGALEGLQYRGRDVVGVFGLGGQDVEWDDVIRAGWVK